MYGENIYEKLKDVLLEKEDEDVFIFIYRRFDYEKQHTILNSIDLEKLYKDKNLLFETILMLYVKELNKELFSKFKTFRNNLDNMSEEKENSSSEEIIFDSLIETTYSIMKAFR